MTIAAFSIRFDMPGDGMSVSKIRDFGEELAVADAQAGPTVEGSRSPGGVDPTR